MHLIWPDDVRNQQLVAERAAAVMRASGLVVFPTDTVYGLGADPARSEAIQRVYEVKGRPEEKAIIWLVDSLADAEERCEVGEPARRLAEAFWPGGLTLGL